MTRKRISTIYAFVTVWISLLVAPIHVLCETSTKERPRPNLAALTLVPPSPITESVTLEIVCAVHNSDAESRTFTVELFLDDQRAENRIHRERVQIAAESFEKRTVRWAASGYAGQREIILSVKNNGKTTERRQAIEIRPSKIRSTQRIDGAWTGIYHWSEQEGKRWNKEIRMLEDRDWRELVSGMNELQMNIVVVQEVFRNQMYVGKHTIEEDGYEGSAFYPSRLYPGRMDITAEDSVEAILTAADECGMYVFMGVGLYAWFDFTPGSLEWHKRLASELWEMYGHHPSFYGWYVSEEVVGGILPTYSKEPEEVTKYRREIVEFFKGFREHCDTLAPTKPIMLAPNCHFMKQAESTWRELLQHCDIVCPFGFHRMPEGDVTGEEVAVWFQALCDDVGAHLWMDMEVFLFGPDKDLYPRPIKGLLEDLVRFPNFEKILCYQYPGLLNAPEARKKPGGPDTVKLFLDYKKYVGE